MQMTEMGAVEGPESSDQPTELLKERCKVCRNCAVQCSDCTLETVLPLARRAERHLHHPLTRRALSVRLPAEGCGGISQSREARMGSIVKAFLCPS